MQTRQLGKSDLHVTPVIFGAWAIGGWMWGGNDEADSIEAIRAAIDNGINTIDTAAIYGFGYSEELVAKALKGRDRGKVLIATKCGMRWDTDEGSDPWPQPMNDSRETIVRKNARPASIKFECEQSLKRLKTDVIDLYQIHWPDQDTQPEESIRAMSPALPPHSERLSPRGNAVGWLRQIRCVFPRGLSPSPDRKPLSMPILRGLLEAWLFGFAPAVLQRHFSPASPVTGR